MATYKAINSYRIRSLAASDLFDEGDREAGHLGDFFSVGDGRLAKTTLRTNFGDKNNISLSFEPNGMRCLACPDGHQLTSSRGEGPSPTVQRVVFFLADQAFPPTLGTLRGTCCTFVI